MTPINVKNQVDELDNINDYNQGFSDGYSQKQYERHLDQSIIYYDKGYKDGLIRRYSEKIEISVDRIIEAQKNGRVIRDFDEDLNYYLKNEF